MLSGMDILYKNDLLETIIMLSPLKYVVPFKIPHLTDYVLEKISRLNNFPI